MCPLCQMKKFDNNTDNNLLTMDYNIFMENFRDKGGILTRILAPGESKYLMEGVSLGTYRQTS